MAGGQRGSEGAPGRRGVLLTGLGLLATSLSACTEQTPAAPVPPSADELSLRRAIADARLLQAGALALAVAQPAQASLLNRIAAGHAADLTALGAPTATSTPTPTATLAPPAGLPQLARAEWAAARTALRDGLGAAPGFAVLFTRIAATRVADADLLSTGADLTRPLKPAAPPPGATPTVGPAPEPTKPAVDALNRLLAGQHAAVFAYPLIVARSTGARRQLARDLWAAHLVDRDALEQRLIQDGAAPVAAEPAYDVGSPPVTAGRSAALAARVERGLAALAAGVVAAATGPDRRLGADQLVIATRRATAWTTRGVGQ